MMRVPAFDVEEMNEEQQKAEYTDGKAFSMIVHMKGTERSYQIEVAPPEGKILCKRDCQKSTRLLMRCW